MSQKKTKNKQKKHCNVNFIQISCSPSFYFKDLVKWFPLSWTEKTLKIYITLNNTDRDWQRRMCFCGGEANQKRTKRRAGSQRRRMPDISDRYEEEERWQTQDMMYCLLDAVMTTNSMMYRHGWLEKTPLYHLSPIYQFTKHTSDFTSEMQQKKKKRIYIIITRAEEGWGTNPAKMHLSHLHVALLLSEAAESSCSPTCTAIDCRII